MLKAAQTIVDRFGIASRVNLRSVNHQRRRPLHPVGFVQIVKNRIEWKIVRSTNSLCRCISRNAKFFVGFGRAGIHLFFIYTGRGQTRLEVVFAGKTFK